MTKAELPTRKEIATALNVAKLTLEGADAVLEEWEQRTADLMKELRELHFDRGGYCNCCGGQHPCYTLRLAEEHFRGY